jgi:hypothetical protein
MVWRMAWFLVAAIAISYAIYLVLGSSLRASASGINDPILVRDVLGQGAHQLSGMVMVPTPCHQLSMSTYAMASTSYVLSFKTWREPSVDCKNDAIPRPFSAIIFAPAVGVHIRAEIDGKSLPIVVIPARILVQPLE